MGNTVTFSAYMLSTHVMILIELLFVHTHSHTHSLSLSLSLSHTHTHTLTLPPPSTRRELEEQAVEYEEMYEKRFKLLQQSAKRVTSRKRRRQDDGESVTVGVTPCSHAFQCFSVSHSRHKALRRPG